MIHGFKRIEAQTIARHCGGWLAVSAPDALVHIGVTASTEEEARQALAAALDRWEAILTKDAPSDRRPVTHR